MNTMIRRDSRNDFDSMFESMNKVVDSLWGAPTQNPVNVAPLDIVEVPDALIVRMALPGLRPEDLEVSVENEVLTLKGEIRQGWPAEAKVYHRENRYGAFTRSVRLPEGLDVDRIDATFELGVVTIRVPKAEPKRPAVRRIAVRTSEPTYEPSQPAIEGAEAEA